jgi:hypothetical protein
LPNLLLGERPSDQPSDFDIAPESHSQLDVTPGPGSESEAIGAKKVSVRHSGIVIRSWLPLHK